jgi:hypothetical protein
LQHPVSVIGPTKACLLVRPDVNRAEDAIELVKEVPDLAAKIQERHPKTAEVRLEFNERLAREFEVSL